MAPLPPISGNSSSYSSLPSTQPDSSELPSISRRSQSSSFQSNQTNLSLLSCIDESTGKLDEKREGEFLEKIDSRFSHYAHFTMPKEEFAKKEYYFNMAKNLLSTSRFNGRDANKNDHPRYKYAMALLYYLASLGHLRSCYALAEKLNDQQSLKAFTYYGKCIHLSLKMHPPPKEFYLSKTVLIEALDKPYSRRQALRALAIIESNLFSKGKKNEHFSGVYLHELVKDRDASLNGLRKKVNENKALQPYLKKIEQPRKKPRIKTALLQKPGIETALLQKPGIETASSINPKRVAVSQ